MNKDIKNSVEKIDFEKLSQVKFLGINLGSSAFEIMLPGEYLDMDDVDVKIEEEQEWQYLSELDLNMDASELFCFISTHIKFVAKESVQDAFEGGKVLEGAFSFIVRYEVPTDVELSDTEKDFILKEWAYDYAAPAVKNYLNYQMSLMGIG